MRQLVTAPVLYPTGPSSRREDPLGGGTSAEVESKERRPATGAGGGRLQRALAGKPGHLWSDPKPGLPQLAEMAQNQSTAFLPGSGHALMPTVARAAQDHCCTR